MGTKKCWELLIVEAVVIIPLGALFTWMVTDSFSITLLIAFIGWIPFLPIIFLWNKLSRYLLMHVAAPLLPTIFFTSCMIYTFAGLVVNTMKPYPPVIFWSSIISIYILYWGSLIRDYSQYFKKNTSAWKRSFDTTAGTYDISINSLLDNDVINNHIGNSAIWFYLRISLFILILFGGSSAAIITRKISFSLHFIIGMLAISMIPVIFITATTGRIFAAIVAYKLERIQGIHYKIIRDE